MKRATIWRRIFKKSDYVSEMVERAVEEQTAWEKKAPVPYAPDQRLHALVQRATRANKGAPPAEALELLKQIVAEWDVASKAAKGMR
jgi:hypothetical protein